MEKSSHHRRRQQVTQEDNTLRTRDAVWADVESVTSLLEEHGVDYVLVGGYALSANGLIRHTGDVDVVVRNTPENNRRWIAALSNLPDGAAAELHGDDHPFPVTDDPDDPEPGVIRVFDVFIVDVMPRACGMSYEDLEIYIGRIENGSRGMNVLDLPGLLLTKRGLRSKDISDRQQIMIALDLMNSQKNPSVTIKPPSKECGIHKNIDLISSKKSEIQTRCKNENKYNHKP